MVSRRQIVLSVLVSVSVVLAMLFFYNPFNTASNPSRTNFKQVDLSALHWSGQNEGETVEIEPNYQGSTRGIPIPPFYRYSLAEGLNKAAQHIGGILVPTLLPEGINYSDVYLGPTVDLCFSYNRTDDPSYADIVIEIASVSVVPPIDDVKSHLLPGLQLVQIEDKWVTIQDHYYLDDKGQSWVLAQFFYKSLQYLVNAKYPLTNQDLVTLIGSMKTPS